MIITAGIKALRKRHGVTQQQLAAAIGVRQCAISSYERGTRRPDILLLKRIADYFGVTVDELIADIPTLKRQMLRSKSSIDSMTS